MSDVHRCSLPNRDNLMQPIHMQLSETLKIFFDFLMYFRNPGKVLNILQKKDDAHPLFICEATACGKRG